MPFSKRFQTQFEATVNFVVDKAAPADTAENTEKFIQTLLSVINSDKKTSRSPRYADVATNLDNLLKSGFDSYALDGTVFEEARNPLNGRIEKAFVASIPSMPEDDQLLEAKSEFVNIVTGSINSKIKKLQEILANKKKKGTLMRCFGLHSGDDKMAATLPSPVLPNPKDGMSFSFEEESKYKPLISEQAYQENLKSTRGVEVDIFETKLPGAQKKKGA